MVKINYIKGILAAVLLLCSATSWAYDFQVDGIYYNILSSEDLTCEVTYRTTSYTSYSGTVVIPETVTYNGTTYSVTEIGESAFRYCTGLTHVTIGNSVTSIGNYAFRSCSGLTGDLTIPESVTSIGGEAFYYCTGLTSLTIGESVTNISVWAFAYCTGLTEVTIGNSVNTINQYAFCNCTGLTELTIPESVTSIGAGAFERCTGLTEVNFNAIACSSESEPFKGCTNISTFSFGNSVTIIPDYLCYELTGLTSVTIGNSVTSIGQYAFYQCSALTEMTIPNSVTSIGQYAFYQCSALTEMTIPNSVTSIGQYAFYGCSALTEITIPNSVTKIGSSAFYGCSSLAELSIPESVTEIGSSAFVDCTGLAEVTIPESVTSIGNSAFRNCSGLTQVNFNAIACTSAGSSSSNRAFVGCTNIATVNIGDNVTMMPAYLCYELTELTEITIPNSVTEIGDNAFYNCTKLSELNFNAIACASAGSSTSSSSFSGCSGLSTVNIGENVTIIPTYLCYGLTGLKQVTFPNSVIEIGNSAFRSCTGLTGELIIPNSVTQIGSYAFYKSSGLTSVTIGNSVETIGDEAFSGCTGLTEVTIPNSVTYLGSFSGCTKLTSITIPESVTEIGSSAFYGCTGLTEVNFNAIACTSTDTSLLFYECDNIRTVNFGDNVTIIPSGFCFERTKLTQITIPESVTSIGGAAFYGCTRLTQVNFNAIACTSVNQNTFNESDNISTVNFGDNVTIIPAYLFYNYASIKKVTIPNSVTEIGRDAFYGCEEITEVTIGNSVNTIGNAAFYNCRKLESVTSLNPEPPACAGGNVFLFVDKNACMLYVPKGSKDEYSHATTWSYFYNIYEIDENGKVYEAPTVQTNDATDISTNSATLNGSVTVGTETITERGFEYWADGGEIQTIAMSSNSMKVTVTELEDGVTYTYRAYVTTASDTFYGEEVSFTTIKAPTVQTYEAIDITYNSALLEGLVAAGEEKVLEQGFEYWAEGGEIQTIVVAELSMGITLTGLEQSTTYTYRAYATTASGTTYGEEMTFTTRAITTPTVQTYEATNISDHSATLNGLVTVGDEEVLEQGFEYWAEGGDVQVITSSDLIMKVTLTELEEGASYTFRAYAVTESDTFYGEEMTFTTIKVPTVNTSSATYISEDSATLNGSVTVGNEEILEQGFEYWVAGGEVQTIATTDQLMTITLTGLVSGTTYTYRAYATTASGTTYGKEVTFTTLGMAPPTVLTYEATDITGNSATLKGAIRVGDEEILEHGFVYWTGDGDVQTITSTKDYMSETIAGLKPSTTYTYRAYATTESGTTYGEELSFTTLDYANGVSDVNEDLEEEARYTTDGKKVSQPVRGINIVRYSDGTARKVLVK